MASRILVVEDSATQALALRAVLEEHGFEVECADSAEAALVCLQRGHHDLVLSDIVMPGMSGYDLCRHIKADERYAARPVVLLTSLGDPLDIVRGLECGADNYVTKPYEPDYLAARIRNVLDRQRLRRTVKASLGVNVSFLGTTFSITSEKEQILDLFISSVEDVVRANAALQQSQRELAETQARLEAYARRTAQQAQVSEAKYAVLMLEASDAILVLDLDGRILEANVRATELFGLPMAELRDRLLYGFAVGDSAAVLREQLGGLREQARVEAGEIEFSSARGDRYYCDVSASRTRSEGDELVFAIVHDVTDLKLASERLGKNEALLMEAQRFAQMGSWERDLATGASQWTPELYRILGLDPLDVVPSHATFLRRVHSADRERVAAAIARTCEDGERLNLEFQIVRPDGARCTVHARAEAVLDPQGRPRLIRGTLQDVTERKHLEEQLHQAQKMEAVGQLAGGVAHDFNNLLTVITSYAGLVLSDLPPDAPNRDELLEIRGAADRAAVLTRQLLAFSRRQVLQPQVVHLNSLTENLEKLLRRLIREDITFVTELDPEVGAVWADPGQLEQVLMNLIVNARDAMPSGGVLTVRTAAIDRQPPTSTGEWSVDAAHGEWVLLEVADTGIGMSPEVQARIFEPFFTTKPTGQGTGLGLSTVYGIVRQSGGEIDVESAPGQGTTFRIYLPATAMEPIAAARAIELPPTHAQGEAVLVAEDDDAVRAVAVRILRRSGYAVLEARTGTEALQRCARERVDLVLTDVVMPEMSGFELGQAITQAHPGVRVLFMSGYSRDIGLREGVVPFGGDYIEKPFTAEALSAKVREVLTR